MTDRRSPRPRLAVTARALLIGVRSGAARAVAWVAALAWPGRFARRAPAASAVPPPRWAGRAAIRARPRRDAASRPTD